MSLDARRLLRDAFGTFKTGVTVTTTRDAAGRPLGFTANSFASVSLDPPLLLVSIANSSANRDGFASAPGFAVNVLAESQKALSNTFARPSPDRFAGVAWRPGPDGSPSLDGAAAWFDCATHQVVKAGDHAVLFGRVVAFEASARPTLGYWRGGYFTPAATAEAVATGPAVVVTAIMERAGAVLLVDDGRGGVALPTARAGREGTGAALRGPLAGLGLEAEPGPLYSVYEDSRLGTQHLAFLCPAGRGEPRGAFVAPTPRGLSDRADPASRAMLLRLAEEARVGSYGLYEGNQVEGRVRRLAEGS